jgi:hypothetical protein
MFAWLIAAALKNTWSEMIFPAWKSEPLSA